jgi:hypothetical protein
VDCTYCFGCIGLVKKEFHILNVRYGRKDFFEITVRLTAALAARTPPLAPPPGPPSPPAADV